MRAAKARRWARCLACGRFVACFYRSARPMGSSAGPKASALGLWGAAFGPVGVEEVAHGFQDFEGLSGKVARR